MTAFARLAVTALVAATLLPVHHSASATIPDDGRVVTRWVALALDAVRSGSPALHTGTPGAARTYAMTTTAVWDAVNGIDVAAGASTRGRALLASYAGAPAAGDRTSAASAAAHGVLRALFGSNAAVAQRVDAAHADDLAARGGGEHVESGRAWGAAVAADVVTARADDGSQSPAVQPAGSGPGAFPRPFSGVQFRDLRPFGVPSVAPYRTSGPPALSSERYAEAVAEVQALGSSTDDDPERAAISRHWLAEGGTARETGLWFKAALGVVDERGTTSSLAGTARLFALLGMGIADAVATSWADKSAVFLWRPGDAIRAAGTDGNPATTPDPGWNPRNGAPCPVGAALSTCTGFGGTPEHTSGTATFAGAAAAVLAGFYGTDRVRFAFTGEQPGAAPRGYASFSAAAHEAARSRVFGGIHFDFSDEAGRTAGRGLGKEVVRTRLVIGG